MTLSGTLVSKRLYNVSPTNINIDILKDSRLEFFLYDKNRTRISPNLFSTKLILLFFILKIIFPVNPNYP